MATDLGLRDARPSNAARGSALEALAARRRLSADELRVLAATGIAPPDHRAPPNRPWGADDAGLVRRLHRVRGWSPAAIAVFVNRPEAQVRAALARRPSATGVRKDASGAV